MCDDGMVKVIEIERSVCLNDMTTVYQLASEIGTVCMMHERHECCNDEG